MDDPAPAGKPEHRQAGPDVKRDEKRLNDLLDAYIKALAKIAALEKQLADANK